jgi:putative transcriptional regulator
MVSPRNFRSAVTPPPPEPHHHPGEEWLWAHAIGTAPEAMDLVVASHLTVCPRCRAAVRDAEAIAGALAVAEAPVARPPRPDAIVPDPPADHPLGAGLPRPLLRYAPGGTRTAPWRRLARGIERADLITTPGAAGAFLLRVVPGVAVPRHGHAGEELTLVLTGAYSDEIGRFEAGDVADLDDATTHRPRAEAGETCVCLIALDGPIRFAGRFARLIQPYFRA